MKKQYKNAYNFNNEKALYNSIMRSVAPQIRHALREAEERDEELKDVEADDEMDEAALMELFGLGGSSVKKPEKALSLENTDEENADLFIAWCAYYMSSASNNVAKGLGNMFKETLNTLKESPMTITKGVLKLISGGVKGSVYGVTTIASVILGAISALVKLTVSGVNKAKEALQQLYTTVSSWLSKSYKSLKEKAEDAVSSAKDMVTIWIGTMSAALSATANAISGAGEAFGTFFKNVLEDAQKGVSAAVFAVKTWVSSKSDAVKDWIKSTAGDIRSNVVKAWNNIDKKARKAYNNIAEKLESWLIDIKELVNNIKTKLEDTAKKTKDFVIDKKDNALIWGIQKGVKGLSDKYTEDQVVALVRKCYNESLTLNHRGKYVINEKYFYNKRNRALYESKNVRHKRILK